MSQVGYKEKKFCSLARTIVLYNSHQNGGAAPIAVTDPRL